MTNPVVSLCAAVLALWALHANAAPKVDVNLPHRPKDGMGDVRKASDFGEDGKWNEGYKFIAELRARPADKRNPEELQSVDMAEFALLRHNFETNRTRCVECLKSVYDAGCTSFWGWAAYTYLKECGVDVPEPPKDPLRGLGALGDGVVNLVPKLLEPDAGRRVPDVGFLASATNAVEISGVEDLKPGSPVRRAILRKRLVETCGEAKIVEVLSAKGGASLFSRLWDDDAVLEDFLLSGPVFDAPRALETLMTLFLNDEKEGWSKTGLGRKATVAVAINARKGDDMAETVRHWAAFRRIGEVGGFVKEAGKRDCREWRFIVRRPADAAETLYLNAMRRFPTRRFFKLISNVPYRKKNCFGVGKWAKKDEYMRPWTASGWPRLYLRSRVGGVCVEQSTWAARAANSQGIMAETSHQPGRKATKFRPKGPPHLCWLLREEDGAWHVRNNIRPYSGSSFTLWGQGFQYVQSTERAFSDRVAHDESELLLFAGRVREAAMRCPYNWTAWRAYADGFKAADATIEDLRRYLGELVALQPEGRLVTWDFAHEALDAMAAKGMKKKDLADETARVFAAIPQPKGKISEEMNFEKDALERAVKRFNGFPSLEDEVLAAALAANKDSAAYLPQIFGYAIRRFAKDKKRLGDFFAKATNVLDGKRDGEAPDGRRDGGKINWRRLCTVKGCMEDRSAFRMMADFRNADDPPTGTATVPETDYGAPLASGDALVGTSSGGKGDTPEDYARVSDATPYDPARKGLFATKAQEAPWAVVELAGETVVKGVTVIGAESGLVAWIAGEDGKWSELGGGKLSDGVMRLEIGGEPHAIRSVKVGFRPEAGKKSLCLKKILVYGDRRF